MSRRGAEFGAVQPLLRRGGPIAAFPQIVLPQTSFGAGTAINTAVITRVTPINAFRLGQQITFWLGVVPGASGNSYFNRVRLKLWWARPNKEYRTPGQDEWLPIDRATFGDGPLAGLDNNRYVWMPSPKRLDITPYQTPPPAATPQPNSDSELLDDCLVMSLPSPADPTYTPLFPAPQVVCRWGAFFYPAMGYSLGMTWDGTVGAGAPQTLTISLTYSVGTLGGSVYQESVG